VVSIANEMAINHSACPTTTPTMAATSSFLKS
jgi:hypothetical protein